MIDKSAVWIGTVDLCLAVLSVVIVAVNPPRKAEAGIKEQAEYLLTLDWPVSEDADVDLWMLSPSKKPVFYGSRDVGCARLDTDSRGFLDGIITLADGSKTHVSSYKETIQLRCIEPGSYALGASLYAYRSNGMSQFGRRDLNLKVHVEIIGLNPEIRTVFSKDLILNSVGQTINATGFDLDRDGRVTLTDPPLEPITSTYQRMRATGVVP